MVWLSFPEWKNFISAHCEAYKNLVSNCRRRARSTLRKKTTIAITAAQKVSYNHQHTFCTHVHSERVNFEQRTLYFHIRLAWAFFFSFHPKIRNYIVAPPPQLKAVEFYADLYAAPAIGKQKLSIHKTESRLCLTMF